MTSVTRRCRGGATAGLVSPSHSCHLRPVPAANRSSRLPDVLPGCCPAAARLLPDLLPDYCPTRLSDCCPTWLVAATVCGLGSAALQRARHVDACHGAPGACQW